MSKLLTFNYLPHFCQERMFLFLPVLMPLTSRMLLTCHQSLKQTPSVLSESKNNVLHSFSLFPSLPCSVGSKNNSPIYRYGYKVSFKINVYFTFWRRELIKILYHTDGAQTKRKAAICMTAACRRKAPY